MNRPGVDLDDVQGLVRFGYGSLTDAVYVLACVRDVDAARAWLRSAPVTTAVTLSPPPVTALQIAFTAKGLEALDVPAATAAAIASIFSLLLIEHLRSIQLSEKEAITAAAPETPAR